MPGLLEKFENNRIFTEDEAWALFRLAAIAEACGWTLLVIGIGFSDYVFPGNHTPVLLAGRIHGMLFLLYALASIGLYPALRWSRRRAFIALLASVPPYGSLAFEIWTSHTRRNEQFYIFRNCIALNLLD
ncbi:MAG TPA: DUF3817 domain-containing protein [Candidatus Saccharimonadales bacterium]|nr:DUF3817 domain-containing protein [Candidatus Saccharimonadales bacterium]